MFHLGKLELPLGSPYFPLSGSVTASRLGGGDEKKLWKSSLFHQILRVAFYSFLSRF